MTSALASGSPPDREETLAAAGATLHLEHFLPTASPRLVLVTVHGYAAHAGLYRHVGATLARAGIAVTQFDCRGHGRSTGRRGHIHTWTEYLDDLDLVVARARAAVPDTPWALMGHSQGAAIALDYVLTGRSAHLPSPAPAPAGPSRLVLVAPWLALAMRAPGWKLLLGAMTARLWPTFTMANGIPPSDVSRNPLVHENFYKDPLSHHVATARWFSEAQAAQARILEAASRLAIPCFMALATDDRIADVKTSLALADKVPGWVEVKRYEGLYHELFLEPEWERVLSDIVGWLTSPVPAHDTRHLPPKPPGPLRGGTADPG